MNTIFATSAHSPGALPKPGKPKAPHKQGVGRWLAGLAAAAVLLAPAAWAQTVTMGTAADFGVLAGSAITNTGPTIINGDLGIHPSNASSVTGFPPGVVNGSTHFADGVALQAKNDLTTAYNDAAGRTCGVTVSADLGGSTLVPGVYCSVSSMGLTGTLTLDAQGDPDAVFVFQAGSSLTTASNATVAMINGGQSCNVFWQIGSSATIGTGTDFLGSILALDSITLNTGASTAGRVLARNGAVTLDSGEITVCTLAPAGALTIEKNFNPTTISAGEVSTLTIILGNPNPTVATLTADLVDTLPTGVLIAALPNASTTCAGVGSPIALPGSSSVTLPMGFSIPASGSCTVTVDVSAAMPGSYVNIIPAGGLMTDLGNNPAPAQATLNVLVGMGQVAVPTSSIWGLFLLIAAVLAFAAIPVWRR